METRRPGFLRLVGFAARRLRLLKSSCDLRPHRVKVRVGKGFGEYCLNSIFTEGAHERMRCGDLSEAIDCRGFVDHALARQECEAPALPPKLGELRVGNRAPRRQQFFIGWGHVGTTSTRSRGRSL